MPNLNDEREIIDGLFEDAESALERGALGKASSLFQGILRADPDNVGALRRLAAIEVNGGNPEIALTLFQHAQQLNPNDADLCHGLATALRLMGRDSESNMALIAALRVDPDHGPSLYDQARRQQQEGNHRAAGETFFKLAKQGTATYDTFFGRGVSLYRSHNLIAAERWFHAAALVDPDNHRPFVNLAMIYRVWGFISQAVACLEHAVKLAPDSADAHWNLSQALLVSGDLKRGFAEYEWRFKREGRGERAQSIPRWAGEALDGKTLLLSLEQGVGDAIQFVRFADLLAKKGARVIVESHPGVEQVLATAPGVSAVVSAGDDVEGADYYLPMMSVPYIVETTVESIPAAVPYVSVPPNVPAIEIDERAKLRVALVWRGNPKHENDVWRSVPLSTFNPLLDVDGVSFFSLQVGKGADECTRAPWADRLKDLAPALPDFASTAAAISKMDLVITVDTAVAHLAGALSKPVWVLIPQGNDWRWLTDRRDSPWYPTMKLLRQVRERNWKPAIRAIVLELGELAKTRAQDN